jgi:hypothetical protein
VSRLQRGDDAEGAAEMFGAAVKAGWRASSQGALVILIGACPGCTSLAILWTILGRIRPTSTPTAPPSVGPLPRSVTSQAKAQDACHSQRDAAVLGPGYCRQVDTPAQRAREAAARRLACSATESDGLTESQEILVIASPRDVRN